MDTAQSAQENGRSSYVQPKHQHSGAGGDWLASAKCAGIPAVSGCAENTGLERQEQEQPLEDGERRQCT